MRPFREEDDSDARTFRFRRAIPFMVMGLFLAIALVFIILFATGSFNQTAIAEAPAIEDEVVADEAAADEAAADEVPAIEDEVVADEAAADEIVTGGEILGVNDTIIDGSNSEYYVGEPANASDVNNNIWNQPYADAVMVGTDGNTSVYTQSGKDGSTNLTGTIPKNVALVVDSYDLLVNGKDNTGGNLLVITNNGTTDKDIANYGISYTDGCAQLIGLNELQKLLDENIAVKFARGNWDEKKNQWSYSPWALDNLWIPTGYTYNPLNLTYESDTYPNRDLATDTSVNTSGAAN